MGHRSINWYGKSMVFVPVGNPEATYFREGHWRGVQFKCAYFVRVTLYGNGNSCYFYLAVQIPIVSLLGASPKHGSQTAPLGSFSPEPTSESTVPKLGARGHYLGSTRCPFGTVVFLKRSSYVLGAASPKKQSCLKYLTLLSWRNTLGWEIPCPALPHLPLTKHCVRVVPTIILLTQCILSAVQEGWRQQGKIRVAEMDLAGLGGLSCQTACVHLHQKVPWPCRSLRGVRARSVQAVLSHVNIVLSVTLE